MKPKPCIEPDCDYPRFGKGYCLNHQYLRTDKKPKHLKRHSKPLRQTPIKKKYKVTGEAALFQEIKRERVMRSFVSGDEIKNPEPINFSHVIPKGSYPGYRLRKDNIVILTAAEHRLYDHAKHLIKDNPKWKPLFDLHDALVREYNQEMKVKKI